MQRFGFDESVKSQVDNLEFKVKTVTKICGAYFYLHKNIWIPENFLERAEGKNTSSFEKLKEYQAAVKVAVGTMPKKRYAYRNNRTSKIDFYEYEWAGNQFSRRAPEHDVKGNCQ